MEVFLSLNGFALHLILFEDNEIEKTELLDDKSSLIYRQFLFLSEFDLIIELEYLFIGEYALVTVDLRRHQSSDSFGFLLLFLLHDL